MKSRQLPGVAAHMYCPPSGAITAAFAAVLTLGVGTAQAAVCSVPSIPFPTIQSAVNDPSCDPIDVAPGAYAENVTISRTLTLNGAQAGNPVAGRTSGGASESTVSGANPIGSNPVITIAAANVTVDGFTLKNSLTSGAAVGVDVKTAGGGAVIKNNFVDTINTSDTSSNGTAQAVYLENGPDDVSILGNDLRNVQSARSAKGVHIGDASSADPSTNVVIKGNSMSNITSMTRGAYGVSINNGNGATMNSGLDIQNNTIDMLTAGAGGWVHAIGLEANTPGVLVLSNSISNLTAPAPGGIAVWFESEEGMSFSTGQVNENNLDVTAANFGIAVDPALSTAFPNDNVDGTCNWWGDPSGPGPVGPGAGAKVSPNVDFTPWLVAPSPAPASGAGMCTGGVATTTTTTTSSTTTTMLVAPIGHLKCYKTTDARARTSYTLDLMAGVGGFVNELGCRLRLPAKRICVQVTKQAVQPPPPGGGPTLGPNVGAEFLSYNIRCPRQSVAPVAFHDQFGGGLFSVRTPKELLVPALPGPPNSHLKCYKTRDPRPRASYTLTLQAGVAGFTNETGCRLKLRAKEVCVGVTKQNVVPPPPGGGPPAVTSGAKLISYRLTCPAQTLPATNASDQFGPGLFAPRKAAALLVPSSPSGAFLGDPAQIRAGGEVQRPLPFSFRRRYGSTCRHHDVVPRV